MEVFQIPFSAGHSPHERLRACTSSGTDHSRLGPFPHSYCTLHFRRPSQTSQTSDNLPQARLHSHLFSPSNSLRSGLFPPSYFILHSSTLNSFQKSHRLAQTCSYRQSLILNPTLLTPVFSRIFLPSSLSSLKILSNIISSSPDSPTFVLILS